MVERIGSIEEAERRRDLRPATVGRASAWIASLAFLATIAIGPIGQHIDAALSYRQGTRDSRLPECYGLADQWPSVAAAYRTAEGGWLDRVFAGNRRLLQAMREYEREMEDRSWLTRLCLPRVQQALAVGLRGGTESVWVGRGGWLFYRPDVEYVTGAGFLDPRTMARRRGAGAEWERSAEPDPRPAVLDFDRELRRRGIRLIVMPVPVKPVVHPDGLSGAAARRAGDIQNASYAEFVHGLRRAGVPVFDSTGVLRQLRDESGGAAYLTGDTHWRPEGVDAAARSLAGWIRSLGALAGRAPTGYRRVAARVEGEGDTAAMLRPPGVSPSSLDLESVEIQRVVRPDDGLWEADPSADVLVLGDSFVNIYALPSLGWGAAAGLAEQLSYHLQRPVDRIARNDRGADATRRELAERLAAGEDRLSGKRIVVWVFSMRELADGDWAVVPISGPVGLPGAADGRARRTTPAGAMPRFRAGAERDR